MSAQNANATAMTAREAEDLASIALHACDQYVNTDDPMQRYALEAAIAFLIESQAVVPHTRLVEQGVARARENMFEAKANRYEKALHAIHDIWSETDHWKGEEDIRKACDIANQALKAATP